MIFGISFFRVVAVMNLEVIMKMPRPKEKESLAEIESCKARLIIN